MPHVDLHLKSLMYRVRSAHSNSSEDVSVLANSFALLNAIMVQAFNPLDSSSVIGHIKNYFRQIYGDSLISLPVSCTGDIDCILELYQNLGESGYLVSGNNGAVVTDKGVRFLNLSVQITLNDILGKSEVHTGAIYDTAMILYEMLTNIGLTPVIIPSFPLLKCGVYYDDTRHSKRRYLVPDLIVKLPPNVITYGLGHTGYLGIEVQRSHFYELIEKQKKYVHLNASRFPFLYPIPIYIVRSGRYKDAVERKVFLKRVNSYLSDALEDVPVWKDTMGDDAPSPFTEFTVPFYNTGIVNGARIEFANWSETRVPRISDSSKIVSSDLFPKMWQLVNTNGADNDG